MRYVLGFDGGGTKTDCVLMDETGAILARSRSGPSNPYRIGYAAAFGSLKEAAQSALAESHLAPASIAALYAGLGGVGAPDAAEKMRALLAPGFPQAAVGIGSDLDLALAAAPTGPCIVLVAGTGSAAIGRNAGGETARIGGHGPMMGDEGSAYDIGRRAVMAAVREYDRSGTDTALGKRILQEMGSPKWAELRKRVQAAPDEVFPRLFAVVATLAEAGDQASQGILRAAGFELASLAVTLAVRLHVTEDLFQLVKMGGMIGRSKFFDAQLHERLRVTLPNAQQCSLELPLAEAAARLALGISSAADAPRR